MQLFANPVAASAASPQADPTSGTTSNNSSSSSSTATISADDFLQLLVTELQNQDLTADTDPNQYINQLVQVNSLEQLIEINQDLTPSTSSGTTSGDVQAASGQAAQTHAAVHPAAPASPATAVAPGNLSAPAPSSSASRIADALGTAAQTLAPGGATGPLDSVLTSLRARAQQARTSPSNPAH